MIAQRHAPSAKLCLRVFVQLLEVRASDDTIVHASLMGIDRLLPILDDGAKREALLWVIKTVLKHEGSDVCDGLLDLLLRHGDCVIPQTEEVCRIMTQRYASLSQSTRLTLLLLLVKLVRIDTENEQIRKMFDYVLELNAKDIDVEVRVQARNIRAVLSLSFLAHSQLFTSENPAVEAILDKITKPDNRPNEYLSECHLSDYYLGSLSLTVLSFSLFSHAQLNENFHGFIPLPDWTDTPVPGELRDPAAIEAKQRAEEEAKERERRAKEKAERAKAKPKSDKAKGKASKEEEEYSDYSYSDYSYSEEENEKKGSKEKGKASKEEEYSDYSYSDYSYSEEEEEKKKKTEKTEKKEEEKPKKKEEDKPKKDDEKPKEKSKEKEEYSDYSYSDYSYSDV